MGLAYETRSKTGGLEGQTDSVDCIWLHKEYRERDAIYFEAPHPPIDSYTGVSYINDPEPIQPT